ncbi:holo-ACP synthase [Clostridium senegalense]|uniref:holo-ACP synthase n=1 Tax=Clostridium senegalense TaxID=1465809 RepID=UPI0002899798|nr:holo-ACP synthase [Clostridium senegalense]MBU5226449.1 holo-ACP synthase [Clostridium senegalense]
MIVGIGVDIVEIRRIKSAIERNSNFTRKILSDEELECIAKKPMNFQYIAGRFAAKEAISKALGTGFRQFGLKDLVIINDELGKPMVTLKEKANEVAKKHGQYKIHLSISHGEDNAVAYAILEVN